jgi:probable rRNA maturation factor
MSIEVNNESGATVDEVALIQLSRFVLDKMGIDPLAELSLVLLDTDSMAALHQQWMDLPGPTDVMAFPMDAEDLPRDEHDLSGPRMGKPQSMETLLGDVVLCPDVAAQQAKIAGHSTEAELHLLCTHGILHLLGYDHGEPEEEREMFGKQAELVGAWAEQTGRSPIKAPLPGTGGEVRTSTAHGSR